MTVDQWILEYIRANATIQQFAGTKVFLYEVPAKTKLPYLHVQLINGRRSPRTQTKKKAGSTRFQVDTYGEDRFLARTTMELLIDSMAVFNLLDRGLMIENIDTIGLKNLPSEDGFRFSADLQIKWTLEE